LISLLTDTGSLQGLTRGEGGGSWRERRPRNDLNSGQKLVDLRKFLGVKHLKACATRLRQSIASLTYVSPAKFINPDLFLERVRPNALAPYLAPLYEMFFRAEDPEKIQLILDPYVDTAELRKYDTVLHSMLRQIERALPKAYRRSGSRAREGDDCV
jgi:hypothetical protein